MEDKDSLIGKEIKGFKFSGYPTYIPHMQPYEGVVGKITFQDHNVTQIRFPNGRSYNYPYPESLNHLVVEEELTIEQILNNIKKLTSEL